MLWVPPHEIAYVRPLFYNNIYHMAGGTRRDDTKRVWPGGTATGPVRRVSTPARPPRDHTTH